MADTKPRPAPGASANTEPPIRVTAGWTPARVDLAQRRADTGSLELAADLWERVMGDPRVIGPLEALVSIVSLDLKFESALDLKEGQTDPAVEALESDWWKIWDADEILGEAIRWMVGLGVALLHRSEWRRDERTGRLLPVWEVWHPRCLKYDSDRNQWQVRTAQSGSTYIDLDLESGEWLLLTPYGKKRPWARAPWFGLGMLWLLARYSTLDWADYNDLHGKPIKAAENTKPETHGLLDEAGQQRLANQIDSLARGGTIVLPDGYTLLLKEAAARGWESFLKVVDEVWPKSASITLTGNNLTTQVDGGSFAAATVHASVKSERIGTVASTLSSGTRRALHDWTRFNFGHDDTPWPKWDTTPPADEKAEADRLVALGTAVQQFQLAGVPLDMVALAQRLGIPVDLKKLEETPPAQLFQYHFTFGIITINEARERLGLPPIKDGDKPPTPMNVPGGFVDPEAMARYARLEQVRQTFLAKAADVSDADWAEAFADAALATGGEPLEEDMSEVLRIAESARSPEELQTKLAEFYADADPAEFMSRMERALIYSAMAGRLAAVKEL